MKRTRAPGAGNARELKVMAVLAEEGWLCASRRHIGGAGDVLAVRRDEWAMQQASTNGWKLVVCRTMLIEVKSTRTMLIEVKSTTRNPWNDFGPADRQALVETALQHGAEPWLYWWPPRKSLQRVPFADFPKARSEVEVT